MKDTFEQLRPGLTNFLSGPYPMSTLKNDKKIAFDKLSSQERQAIYNASPFFKKKNEEAAAFLKKHPIPKEFIKQ
jgi:hypothetical protein